MDLNYWWMFLAVGLVLQIAARLAPFRGQTGPRELALDVLALLAFVILAMAFDAAIAGPLFAWWTSLPAVQGWYGALESWPPLLTLLANIVVADFLVYWSHRALHGDLLWHTHAFHHSSKHVWWLAGLRSTPVHAVLTALPDTIAVLLFPPANEVMLLALVLFTIGVQHWIHSNVRLPFERALETLFVTPRVHFVHHSADVRFTNTNYAFVLTLWDRMFGTFADPEAVPADEPLGLDYQNTPLRMILGLPPPRRVETAAEASSPETEGGHGIEGLSTERTRLRRDSSCPTAEWQLPLS